jgi:hypothetical protein
MAPGLAWLGHSAAAAGPLDRAPCLRGPLDDGKPGTSGVVPATDCRPPGPGQAQAIGPVEAGGAVQLLRQGPGWSLVRAGAVEGWVSQDAIAVISG